MIDHWRAGDRERIAEARIGVAGCGGLGSNCALALARAGVGTLVILDHDRVEAPNLNRQAFTAAQVGQPKTTCLAANIAAAAPSCRVEAHDLWYAPGMAAALFQGCQVVVEAFDRPEAKAALVDDVLSHLPDAWVVCGSGIAGIGGNNALRTRRFGRLWVVGDGATAAAPEVPLLGPRVMAAAALQANAVLSILLEDLEP